VSVEIDLNSNIVVIVDKTGSKDLLRRLVAVGRRIELQNELFIVLFCKLGVLPFLLHCEGIVLVEMLQFLLNLRITLYCYCFFIIELLFLINNNLFLIDFFLAY